MKPTTGPRGVALHLRFSGMPTSSDQQQAQADATPLFLASHGVQGKLHVEYNNSGLAMWSGDIVKISLHGMM